MGNPALPVPEGWAALRAPKMVSNTYVVVGPRVVFGHSRGETFEMVLTEAQEAHLIEAGHLAVAEVEEAPEVESVEEVEQAPVVDVELVTEESGQEPEPTP